MVAGSEIKINEHGVFITTPKIFKVKAETTKLLEGEQVPMPNLPFLPKLYTLCFHFTNDDNVPYAHTAYTAHNKVTGELFEGITDDKGKTQVFYTDSQEDIEIHLDI
ncbi:Uncharacterised protein [Moraxella lacunata]|uniref:Uncharacterized protein n=2 Tax=Moraxella TaxID=475 RepID=A0A1V4GT74_MORLA|nr:hypothetical protein [Moraxella lacunata]OPH35845.1 hypothetical protein B5J94_08510 [Moraxella lacunata]STZ00641.1 Uncharacterised protein [Moraxella lacunata]